MAQLNIMCLLRTQSELIICSDVIMMSSTMMSLLAIMSLNMMSLPMIISCHVKIMMLLLF